MGVNAEGEEPQSVSQVVLPDGLVPFEELLAAPSVIDEDIKSALLRANAVDQRANLLRHKVINLNGDTLATSGRHKLRCVLDGFGPRIFRLVITRRSSGHIDRGA